MANQTWQCRTCGDQHSGLTTVFGPAAPDPWITATEAQRAAGEINADTCVLPDEDHPLVHEQLHGITMHRVAELNSEVLGR